MTRTLPRRNHELALSPPPSPTAGPLALAPEFAILADAKRLRLFCRGREVRPGLQRPFPRDKVHRQGETPALRQPLHQAASAGRAGPGQHRGRRGASGGGLKIP